MRQVLHFDHLNDADDIQDLNAWVCSYIFLSSTLYAYVILKGEVKSKAKDEYYNGTKNQIYIFCGVNELTKIKIIQKWQFNNLLFCLFRW